MTYSISIFRILNPRDQISLFLFGPRGTGKTIWIKYNYPNATYIDLLDDEIFNQLLANPKKLISFIEHRGGNANTVIIDEIQKVPKLLDEVHRLIETKKYFFILTGSNARKLKKTGANLLAGRAYTYEMFPFSAFELGSLFQLDKALLSGTMPMSYLGIDSKKYLQSYVRTYLQEEIINEGLSRNIQSFARFLQIASFSQGSLLVANRIASDSAINRKVVEDYFQILKDLLLSIELPVFTKRAKRELISKNKFYFFDAGLFRALRPKGPLDSDSELNGLALETLVLNELRVINSHFELGYELFYWRTRNHLEVDFILYGELGLKAIEVKLSDRIRNDDLRSLLEFKIDYPEAELLLLYGGNEYRIIDGVEIIPIKDFFNSCLFILK